MDREAQEAAVQSTFDELAYLRIKPSQLFIGKGSEIGYGGYGEVHLATLDGSRKVAVKQLHIVKATGTQFRVAMRLARELKTWSKAHHPNVLTLVGYYLSENYDCAQLVSPYMPNGNITDYIKRKKPSTEVRLGFARDVTLGMAYLHKSDPQICHGDLKPANVLVSNKLEAVLCDFGLATFVQNSEELSGLTTSAVTKGSPRYMSPELFQKDEAKHTLESDVWAWACTVFEIITDNVPYSTFKGTANLVLAHVRRIPPGSLDLLKSPALDVDMPLRSTLDTLRHLVPNGWSFSPDKRPSFSTILDCIERGVRNPASDLSREESPQQPSVTQEASSTYLDDLLSLENGNHAIPGSSTGAPPARKATAQSERLPTTSSTSSTHQDTLIDFSFDFLDQSNSSQFTAIATEQATPATKHLDQGSILTLQQSEAPIFSQDDLEALLFDTNEEVGTPTVGDTLGIFTPPLRPGRASDKPPTEPVKQGVYLATDPAVTTSPQTDSPPGIRETCIRRPTVQAAGLPDSRSGSRCSSPSNHGSPRLPNPTPLAPQPAPHPLPTNLPPSSRKPGYEAPTTAAPDTPTDSGSLDNLSTRHGASGTTLKPHPSVKRPAKMPPGAPKVNEAAVPHSPDLETGPREAARKRAQSSRNLSSKPSTAPESKDSNPRADHQVVADTDNSSTLNEASVASPRAHPRRKRSTKLPPPPSEVTVAPVEVPVLPSPDVGPSPPEAALKRTPSRRNPASKTPFAPPLGDSHPLTGLPAPPAPTQEPTHRKNHSSIPVTSPADAEEQSTNTSKCCCIIC